MPAARFAVRRSSVHGRGVFARADLAAGELLGEYRGERIDWPEAVRRHEAAGTDGHTFLFDLADGTVVDGGAGGNSMRWLNHGCRPNCVAVERDGRIYIETLRRVSAGAELLIDYNLSADGSDPEDQELYACRCGARGCRGTMLAAR